MKKKLLWCAGIIALIALIVLGVFRYIEVRHRQTDPNWKLAQQIYKMENALKEVDEDYACKSLSKVTPFTYTDSEGNIITYYCCQTTYLSGEYGEDTGLNTDAIGMVIDFTQIQNRRECKVNAYEAFLCEMGDRSYRCWTISPEISCVIEYGADAIGEKIFSKWLKVFNYRDSIIDSKKQHHLNFVIRWCCSVCQKTYFLTDWQRSKEPPRQANRTRRRTGGTVAFGLRSKSKCLAQQGLFANSEKYAFLLLIRRK